MKIIAIITILNFVTAQPESNKLSGLQVDSLQIDMQRSKIEWVGRKFTGEHSGSLRLSEGWVIMNDSSLIGGKFIIDMTSIKNTDIQSPEWKLKLENHLKSNDFFNVDSFPQAILEINKNSSIPGVNNLTSEYLVSADLTICGLTREIIFPYQLEESDSNFIAIGSVDVNRTLYNIKYKSGTFFFDLGDKIIYDNFTIKFTVHTLSF